MGGFWVIPAAFLLAWYVACEIISKNRLRPIGASTRSSWKWIKSHCSCQASHANAQESNGRRPLGHRVSSTPEASALAWDSMDIWKKETGRLAMECRTWKAQRAIIECPLLVEFSSRTAHIHVWNSVNYIHSILGCLQQICLALLLLVIELYKQA